MLRNESDSAVDEASSVIDVSSPEEPLKVAVLALVGSPVLQLPDVPQSLEDVLVHISTWAWATTADRYRVAPARSLQAIAQPVGRRLVPPPTPRQAVLNRSRLH